MNIIQNEDEEVKLEQTSLCPNISFESMLELYDIDLVDTDDITSCYPNFNHERN